MLLLLPINPLARLTTVQVLPASATTRTQEASASTSEAVQRRRMQLFRQCQMRVASASTSEAVQRQRPCRQRSQRRLHRQRQMRAASASTSEAV